MWVTTLASACVPRGSLFLRVLITSQEKNDFCYFISPSWKKPEYVSEFVQWKSSLRGLFLSLENACKGTSRDCELVDIWSEMAVLMDMWWSPAVTGFFFFSSKEFCCRNISPTCWSLYQDCFQLGVLCQARGRKAAAGMLCKAGNRKYQLEPILFDWQGKRVHLFHKQMCPLESEFGQKQHTVWFPCHGEELPSSKVRS